MKTAPTRYLAASTFTTAYLAAFLYSYLVPVKLVWYEPAERLWRYTASGTPVGMDFYGRIALALIAGVLTTGCAIGVVRLFRLRLDHHSFALKMTAGYAVILTVSALGALAWLFSHRTIIPPDLP